MRTIIQLCAMLLACSAACWFLSFYTRSLPARISGIVIDWNTGRPAPDIEVRVDELNGSAVVAQTNAHGRFTFQPSDAPRAYFLFAAPPRYGKLLQTTFGQTMVLYHKSEQVSDVVIPAIAGTELSGHVYGSDGKPISGCYVSALTRAPRFDPLINLQLQGVFATQVFERAERDDPEKFLEAEDEKTGADKRYVFNRLGADRYFILARCIQPKTQGRAERFTWAPMLYADANSIASAKEILLLPGDRKRDIDFHLQRKRTYMLKGKIVFSDHLTPKPWPEAI